jgi:hypothetical protein
MTIIRDRRFNLVLSEDEETAMRRLANKRGISPSGLLRMLLQQEDLSDRLDGRGTATMSAAEQIAMFREALIEPQQARRRRGKRA